MSDEHALLAAILSHPDEDTPRLMYADWLDEHARPAPDPAGRANSSPGAGSGSARAEFIRLQCAPALDDDSIGRTFDLEERNRAKWLAGFPNFPPARWVFRRGFPDCLETPAWIFLERYDAFARVPWLRSLSLYDLDNSTARDFVGREWPPQWAELELAEDVRVTGFVSGYDGTPTVAAVARCPQARQLRSLRLYLFTITPDGVRELAASPHLEGLERLYLGDPGAALFAPLRERFGARFGVD